MIEKMNTKSSLNVRWPANPRYSWIDTRRIRCKLSSLVRNRHLGQSRSDPFCNRQIRVAPCRLWLRRPSAIARVARRRWTRWRRRWYCPVDAATHAFCIGHGRARPRLEPAVVRGTNLRVALGRKGKELATWVCGAESTALFCATCVAKASAQRLNVATVEIAGLLPAPV